jgi:hypothetical protein
MGFSGLSSDHTGFTSLELTCRILDRGAGGEYHPDINEAGTYLHISTDQVRFYPIDTSENRAQSGTGANGATSNWRLRRPYDEPIPLSRKQIPALVFSEVMRDVDLFVDIASVDNDPS